MNRRRLYRSADDRWIAGVAAGVADYFDVDPIIARILWIVSVPFTGGLTLLAYLIMIVAVPIGPEEWPPQSPWAPGGAPVGTAPGVEPAAPSATASAGAGWQTASSGAPAATGSPADPTAASPGPAATAGPDWRWQRRQDRWQRRAEKWQQHAEGWEHRSERSGSSGLVFGLLLVLVGGVLAWKEIFPSFDLNLGWPIAVILFGAVLVVSSIGWRDRN